MNKKKKVIGRKLKTAITREIKIFDKKNTELKYQDTVIDSIVDGNTNTPKCYFSVTDIDQGLYDTARVGDEINLKWIEYRLNLFLNKAATTGGERALIRFIVFQYHPVVDATYATMGTSLPLNLVLAPGYNGTDITTDSHYTWDRKRQFTVLHDSVHYFFNYSALAGTPKMLHGRIPLKKAQKKVHYIAADDTQASNHIIFCLISQNVASIENDIVCNGTVRTTWTDK